MNGLPGIKGERVSHQEKLEGSKKITKNIFRAHKALLDLKARRDFLVTRVSEVHPERMD